MAKKLTNSKPAQPKGGKKSAQKPRATKSGPTEPSRPTVKRLFAVSGNRCAFSGCKGPLVDPQSGSVIGQICHIKGEKPGSARYDTRQSDEDRQGFENLILMCGPHHKVIDDDEKTHTVERLLAIKKSHEAGQPQGTVLADEQADRMIANISGNTVRDGSIIQTQHQSGGQVAHTINNYNSPPPEDENVVVEGSLSVVGRLELLQAFGCPGVMVTVVCRSKRPAKLRKVTLSAEGHGFLAAFEAGFGEKFGHTPPKGHETETLSVTLARLSPPNSPEGYVLNRDDVCRFYLPMCLGGIGVFLTTPPENVTIRVVFFDNSDRVILRGEEVQAAIRGLVQTYGNRPYSLKIPMSIAVRVTSTALADLPAAVGTTNPNLVSFIDSAPRQLYFP